MVARASDKPQLLIWGLRNSFYAFSLDWRFILVRAGRVSWQLSHVSLVCSATFLLSVCVASSRVVKVVHERH